MFQQHSRKPRTVGITDGTAVGGGEMKYGLAESGDIGIDSMSEEHIPRGEVSFVVRMISACAANRLN